MIQTIQVSITALMLCTATTAWGEATRRFHIDEAVTVPEGGAHRVLFIPVPQDDPWQTVTNLAVDGATPQWVHDERDGNAAVRFAVPDDATTVHLSFDIERHERSADLSHAKSTPPPNGYARWLGDDAHVRVTERIRQLAQEHVGAAKTPLDKARALYGYVLSTMRYEKKGTGWGNGDLIWACDNKYGNCTDFHALLSGLLRAEGIPARFQIGYSVPTKAGLIPGYHCWMDFYVDGAGWIPVDASEAWKHPEKRDYFFGHHDADRFAVAVGRDITLPGMQGPPLNYFVYPYLEVEGKPGPAPERLVQFTER